MDFSESSKNGKASGDAEAAPAEGVDAPHGEAKGECLVCYEDLSVENYCEFQLPESSTWYPAAFCFPCIEILRKSQFKRYCDGVANSTCAREQRALLRQGPPVNLKDKNGFPGSEGREVSALWTAKDGCVRTAKLEGSLEGAERDKLWIELKSFMIETEEAEDAAPAGGAASS